MDEKETFGAYIRQKRQQAGLTQKELACALYVTESSVSKWERALSYPDVSLVPAICEKLHISEHEFFTACDDDQARLQERASRRWQNLVKGWQIACIVGYAAALIPCFICNIALFHALDWFWIVLTSLALAFCGTNLPFLVKRHKGAICMGAASGCLMLLLLACWLFTGGRWLAGGIALVGICLALPWAIWALWWFYGKHLSLLNMVVLSGWVLGLLAAACAVAGGSWLLPIGYPLAGLSLGFLWAYYGLSRLPVNRWTKAGLCVLLAGAALPAVHGFVSWVLPGQDGTVWRNYFNMANLLARRTVGGFSWVNILLEVLLILAGAALLIVGLIRWRKNRW